MLSKDIWRQALEDHVKPSLLMYNSIGGLAFVIAVADMFASTKNKVSFNCHAPAVMTDTVLFAIER